MMYTVNLYKTKEDDTFVYGLVRFATLYDKEVFRYFDLKKHVYYAVCNKAMYYDSKIIPTYISDIILSRIEDTNNYYVAF